MNKFSFSREPATWLALLNAVLGLLVSLHVFGLTDKQAGALGTAVTAAVGLVTAWLVKPFAPTVATYFAGAVWEAFAAFHLEISPNVIAATNLVLLALVAAAVRPQSTPKAAPAIVDPALATRTASVTPSEVTYKVTPN